MSTDDVLALVGRLFLAIIFLASAFGKITNFEGTLQYMDAHGMPLAYALCVSAIAVESLGAVALILGYKTRWGAGALAVFLITATAVFHTAPDQRIQLLKNLAILGGLLTVLANGPGPISLEGGSRS
ncbi:MAG: DoxX family protein [Elusimicrobiota bacterium]|nr:DoxX family protein [Elusimicrobiota bacterium]